MEFLKSRSFLLALISTFVCLIIFYGYAQYYDKLQLKNDTWFLGILFFILNSVLFFVLYSNNIVSRKLILNEDRLKFAMKTSNEGIYDWDLKTNKIYFSPQYTQMLGYGFEEFGQSLEAVVQHVHKDDLDVVLSTVKQYLNDEIPEFSIEFRMYHKNKSIIWVNSRGEVVKNYKNEPVRLIGVHRDITNQKNIEENLVETIGEVEQKSEAKASFLAHMSHEIRTPLTAITGIAEILQKQSSDFNEKQQTLIKTLSSSSQSLKELINDILDFSKIDKGDIEITSQYFSVFELVAEITSIMSAQAQEKNIQFNVVDDAVENLEYLGDKARIRQILLNLVGNALKFTENGKVTFLAETNIVDQIETLDFIVQDTGIGIHDDVIDSIFNEFQQADRFVSKKYGGTGLGLPISRKLATLMGGTISVSSKYGMGSTFTLSLPLVDRQKQILDKDPNTGLKISQRLSSAIRKEHRALIVDDYDGNIIILTFLMDEIGLKYDVASNGVEAVEVWKSNHYDLVLMDVKMPVMDGLAATKSIRQYEDKNQFEQTPIIGMTAHALVEDQQKCIDAGMTDYISKPIDSIKLQEKIYHYLYNKN